ncbi:StbB family protein [Pelomonas sp. Root1217]|uniref:StbB family protein n=1 Tax=Pelomonas sp. Root1217 TaxID=1736430 RepID=UPI001F29B4A9|nr:StbB family protein [Pelomonas sp. Root1217]
MAKHLLKPRIPDAEVITIESINADEGEEQALRGRQFAELQEYLQITDNVIVDIGASNVEELLSSMKRYRGSHGDFDHFIVPTVAALKQQQDTIATLVELAQLGVPACKVRVLFNMVEDGEDLAQVFDAILSFLVAHPVAQADPACRIGANEIYGRIRRTGVELSALLADETDYKALIAAAKGQAEKIRLAQRLAARRLAAGVVPELDDCFAALRLDDRPRTSAAV